MKFEAVERLPQGYTATKNINIIEDFLKTEHKIAKLVDSGNEYKNNMSMRNSLATTIKRFKYGVTIKMVAGEVYLIRN